MPNAAIFVAGLASIVLNTSRRVATVPVGDLKHPPNWVRQDSGSKEERIALARSYQARPINLILISPNGVIRDGNRRVASIIEDTGPETPVMVCITDEEITPAVMLEIQFESAEHTKSLAPYEQYVGYSKWLELNPGATAKDLAEKIHRHEATISKTLSLDKCVPEVLEAAKAGKLSVNDWALISRSNPEDQPGLLEFRLSPNSTRDMLQTRSRKRRTAAPTAVRMDRVKIAMPDDKTVVITGNDLGMAELVELLAETLKEARKAAEIYDVKTFQNMMRDRAKAAG